MNVATYYAAVRVRARRRQQNETFEILAEMRKKCIEPDARTRHNAISAAIRACEMSNELGIVLALVEETRAHGPFD